MNKETVQDDFYKSGPDPKPAKPKRKRRRRSSGDAQFDVAKKGQARANNRGARRVLRKVRRQKEFRMKLLWILTGGVVAAILIYAVVDHMRWSRIERLPPDERSAAMKMMVEKNRRK